MSKLTRENAILPFTPARDLTGLEGVFTFINDSGLLDHYHYYYGGPASGAPFGAILHGTDVNEKTSVAISAGGFCGTLKLKLGGAVEVGDLLQVLNTGAVTPDAESGARILVGMALESGVADELVEAVIFKPIEFTA